MSLSQNKGRSKLFSCSRHWLSIIVITQQQLLLWLGLIRPFKRKGKLSDPVNQMHIILYKIWQSGGLIYIHKTGQVWTIAVNRFMKRITWIKDEPEHMIQVYSERKDGKQSNTHKVCHKKWRFVSVCLRRLCCSWNNWKSVF